MQPTQHTNPKLNTLQGMFTRYINEVAETLNWVRPFSETNGYSVFTTALDKQSGEIKPMKLFTAISQAVDGLYGSGEYLEVPYKGKVYRVIGTSVTDKNYVIKIAQKNADLIEASDLIDSFDKAFDSPVETVKQPVVQDNLSDIM